MSLLDQLRLYLQAQQLLPPGGAALVAVSGGPDSLCLLDALSRLAPGWSLTLQVAYFNHGLRPEAAAEVDFVRQAAEARGWLFHTAQADTRAYAAQHGRSVEEAARELRYDFLARTALAQGLPRVAVAHTADDQAETVLMHFLRGAGLAGLRGMLPQSNWPTAPEPDLKLIRPLLATTRAEVEAYCRERGLRPLQDASNADPHFFRNRLRHVLLPELEAYNPNLRAVLSRTAEVAAGEYALVQSQLRVLWRRLAREEGLQIEFERARWLALTRPEQRLLLREAVRRLAPAARDVDFTPIEQAIRFSLTARPGRQCDVTAGLRLKVTRATLALSAWDYWPARADRPWLSDDGQLAPPWRFKVEGLAEGAWSLAAIQANPDPWRAYVDAEALPAPLTAQAWHLRGRRPGDRFQPLGLGGRHVTLADFFINTKIDQALRDRWPLVMCGDALVWVAGLRLDERFQVSGRTRQVAALSFVQTDS